MALEVDALNIQGVAVASGGASWLGVETGSTQSLTFTVPGGTLANDDEFLVFSANSSGTNVVGLTVSYGGTQFASSSPSATVRQISGTIQRTGASAQRIGCVYGGSPGGGGGEAALTKANASDQDLVFTWARANVIRNILIFKVS